MDLSMLGNLVSQMMGNSTTSPVSESINVPGTIMGNLKNVSNTQKYIQNYARYNNYMTDNYGAAQMASDRYMSLKERIPMSIEYYLTPTKKKEVVLYINPNKLSINTQKLKAKVYTRGGIYFHHYGDDVWTLDITGETGMSQMKGIEALEEVYHYSGTLLKYQNVDVSTVHTNKITSLTNKKSIVPSDMQKVLQDIGLDNISQAGSNAIAQAAQAVGGQLGISSENLKKIVVGNTNNSTNQGSNGVVAANKNNNVINKFVQAMANQTHAANSASPLSACTSNAINGIVLGQLGMSQKDNLNNVISAVGNVLKGFDSSIINNIATEVILGGGKSKTLDGAIEQINSLIDSNQLLTQLTGRKYNATSVPNQATQGNYYTLITDSILDLNKVVASVQKVNESRKIDHTKAAQAWSDIEDNLTDLYRPRQVFIYFDDRIFIGHFDQFTWTRVATTMSITYTMKFTVTRQIKVPRSGNGHDYSNLISSSLNEVLTGTGTNATSTAGSIAMAQESKEVNDIGYDQQFNNDDDEQEVNDIGYDQQFNNED